MGRHVTPPFPTTLRGTRHQKAWRTKSHGQRDSNSQPPDLESDAPPLRRTPVAVTTQRRPAISRHRRSRGPMYTSIGPRSRASQVRVLLGSSMHPRYPTQCDATSRPNKRCLHRMPRQFGWENVKPKIRRSPVQPARAPAYVAQLPRAPPSISYESVRP